MKLRASVGLVGNDKSYAGRFLYIPDSYQLDGGYFFGTNVSNKVPGAYEATKSNLFVTWEKATKQNYGIDFAVLSDRLSASLDYFREDRRDILDTPDFTPGILGMVLPVVNVGETKNQGFEAQIKWTDMIGQDFR